MKIGNKVTLTVISILILTGSALIGYTYAAEPYNLGVALGITGTGASYAKDGVDAVKLAVEEINGKGGFLGKHPIKLFIRDTRTNPEEAARQAKNLILKDHVRAVLGTYSSSCALAVKPICRRFKTLHVAALSNSEDITLKDFSPYTYSVVPNTYMQSKAVALQVAKLAKEKGWITYCTIASDYSWGRSAQQNVVKQLKKLAPQMRFVKAFWPPLGEKKFSGFVKDIPADRPDCLIGFLLGSDSAAWLKEAEENGLLKRIPYPGSQITVTELIAEAKTLPRGLIGVARAPFFAHLNVPMMAGFVEKFRAAYNRYPSDWGVLEYDAVYALKQGIEKAGSIESGKVKDAMKGMSIDTCRGKLAFREIDNQLNCSVYTGVVADVSEYPFPIYRPLWEIKAQDSWRPESEIIEARAEEKK